MNKLHLLNDILYNGLQPWLSDNNPDDKFASILMEIKVVQPDFPHKYEVEFTRPFNYKTKYYQKLIIREMNKYCNQVISLIADEDNLQVKKYWLNDTLDKKLKTKLKEIGKLIKEKQLDISYIDPTKNTFELDVNHKTDTYIIQLLKCCLIKIYLEIEHVFLSFRTDVMLIEDFYTQLLFEPIPSHSFLKETPFILSIEPVKSKEVETIFPFAKLSFNSFTYIDLSRGQEKLTDHCDSLKKFQFIAENTPLINLKRLFSGKVITQPVVWTGSPSEFYYYIHLIYQKYGLVGDLKQQQWKVACKCFVQENGTSFDPSSIRLLKKPQLSAGEVEQAVYLLK